MAKVIVLLLLAAAVPAFPQTTMLDYRPVAAEYSAALDRIIMVSGNPNRLYIVDPATGAATSAGLYGLHGRI